MQQIGLRRALAFFVPLAVLATLSCGLAYVALQQDLRMGANDPQVQLAEDASRALDAGARPPTLIGQAKVDVGVSLAPFLAIYDRSGRVLATNGRLDGRDPVPPLGVLDAARRDRPNAVTWQPRAGVRLATVTVAWRDGTVLAGRSLRQVERAEGNIARLVVAGWAVMLLALAASAAVASRLWPS